MNFTNISDIANNIQVSNGIETALPKIIQGIQLISQGISTLIFIPFNYLGITIPGTIIQLIYFVTLIYIVYKLSSSWKMGLGIIGFLILISLPQLASLM